MTPEQRARLDAIAANRIGDIDYVRLDDLRALLAAYDERGEALRPFAREFDIGNAAFIDFVAADEGNELRASDFRRAAGAMQEPTP